MLIRCVWEHNGEDSILYADNFIGAFTRGETREAALSKMADEAASYLKWSGETFDESFGIEIVQEKVSELQICDADSDVLFETERASLCAGEYEKQKTLALKSAEDFHMLYEAVPDKWESCLPVRQTFYGQVPRTAFEMYEHTKSVNKYYFREIGIEADNEGTISQCRARGFALLEKQPEFLTSNVFPGSYKEEWSLRKVLRRFLWHDRIHAKAMYRMAVRTFGANAVPNLFFFT